MCFMFAVAFSERLRWKETMRATERKMAFALHWYEHDT